MGSLADQEILAVALVGDEGADAFAVELLDGAVAGALETLDVARDQEGKAPVLVGMEAAGLEAPPTIASTISCGGYPLNLTTS